MKHFRVRLLGWLLVLLIMGPISLTVWAGCGDESVPASAGDGTPEVLVENANREGTMSLAAREQPAASPSPSPSPRPAQVTTVMWGKSSFELPWRKHGKERFYKVDDSSVQAMCAYVGCRLSQSFVGHSLTAHSYGFQATLSPGEKKMRVNSIEVPTVGRLIDLDGDLYINGELLCYLLGVRAVKEGDSYRLQQLLRDPSFENQGERRLILSTSGAIRWSYNELEDGRLEFFLEDTFWQGEKNSFDFEDLHLDIHNLKDNRVKVVMSALTTWQICPRKGLRANEVVVGLQPLYRTPQNIVDITGLELQDDDPEATVFAVNTSGGFSYYWEFNRQTRVLLVDMAGVNTSIEGPVEGDITGLHDTVLKPVGVNNLPVARLQTKVLEGYAVEVKSTEEEGQLALRISRGDFSEVLGEGETSGFVRAQGVVVIDPGHGGGDSGAVSRRLGIKEKDITLDVAWRLRELLENAGWYVVMTREDDRDVSWAHSPDTVELQSRCDVANNNNASYFISLHCNASTSPRANGSSVYWYKRIDRDFAQVMADCLGSNVGLRNIGVLRDGFYVLRNTDMPAVLVEMAFISNPSDGAKLGNPDFRQLLAEQLAEAFLRYAE